MNLYVITITLVLLCSLLKRTYKSPFKKGLQEENSYQLLLVMIYRFIY